MPSPTFFRRERFRDTDFSEKILRLQIFIICRILWGGIPKKEDLYFDSLCNGCISVGYAKIMEY